MALIEWGLPIVVWLQSLPQWTTPVLRLLSRIGDVETLVVVVLVVLWCVDATAGFRAGVLLLTYGCLNTPMKVVFGLPRPYWVSDQVRALAAEASYGLPSGHAGFGAAVLGHLALAAGAGPLRVAVVALIVAIGVSRVALGVHWPADVLAGWATGGLLLVVALRLEGPLRRRVRGWSVTTQIVAALAVSAAAVGLAVTVVAVVAEPVPAQWLAGAARAVPGGGEDLAPRSIAGVVSAAGTLFGFLSGGALLHRGGGFDADGPLGERLARLVVGVAGLASLSCLRTLLPERLPLVAGALELALFALVGLWISFGAPVLFLRLRLARRPRPYADAPTPAGSVGRGLR